MIEDEIDRITIAINTVRGNNYLKFINPDLDPETHVVHLFMISKGTEVIQSYLDSHFVIVYLITEIEAPKKTEEIKEDTLMQQAASDYDVAKAKLDEQMAEILELRNTVN